MSDRPPRPRGRHARRRTELVAWCADLPGLPAQLRRRATATAPATWPASGPASPTCRDLGVDAIWFTPWYPSPMADGGYDVADYRAIDPLFGDLAEAEGLIARRARARHPHDHRRRPQPRLRPAPVVPGRRWPPARAHRSASGSGSATASARSAQLAPNRWESEFGGPAWSRVTGADGDARAVVPPPLRPGPARPELGAPRRPPRPRGDPAVLVRPRRRRHPDRLGRPGRQGPRPARGHAASTTPASTRTSTATSSRSIYRSWREIADSYGPDRVLVGEVWLPDAERFARYLRPGVLHTAFNFDFMASPWDAAALRALRRAHPRRARAGGRAGDLGAVQPRRHPAGDPLRPRATRRSRSRRKRFGTPTDLAPRHAAGPGRPRCWRWRCPARSTSSRARSSGCPRSRIAARPDRGPDARAVRRRRPRPRRLPRAAALVGRGAAVRVQRAVPVRDLAAPARRLGRPDRRGAGAAIPPRC